MVNKLKPCPFCGGKAELFTNAVYCLKCGCRIVKTTIDNKKYEAEDLWNTRDYKLMYEEK